MSEQKPLPKVRRLLRPFLVLMTVLAALSTTGIAPTEAAQAPAGERPPERPSQATAGPAAAAFAPGETRVRLDQGGNAVYRVDDGYTLDQYLFRSQSPIDFSIDVNRDFGPVDADGHPVEGNALFGKTARITLRAFDVDDKSTRTDVAPERDIVIVNDKTLETPITGANDQWNINTLRFSANELTLPTAANPTGRNQFFLSIDTANSGPDVWAVEVDWAELRLSTEVVPVAMVHGFNGDANDFTDPRIGLLPFYLDRVASLEGRAIATSQTRRGSIRTNTRLLEGSITDLLRTSGADQVNLLAHSKGGLESRLYIFDHPRPGRQVGHAGDPQPRHQAGHHRLRLQFADLRHTDEPGQPLPQVAVRRLQRPSGRPLPTATFLYRRGFQPQHAR